MPRSLRIERENGVYHVINRGNYRQDLFVNEGRTANSSNIRTPNMKNLYRNIRTPFVSR